MTAATATLGHRGHDLVERGLLVIRQERLDVGGLLRAELLHLAHRGLTITVRSLHRFLLLALVGLHDRIGLGCNRVGNVERILEDRGHVRTTAATTTTTALLLRILRLGNR